MVFYLSSAQGAALAKFDKDMLAPFERAYNADPQRSQKYTALAFWGGRAEVRFEVRADGIAASAFSRGAKPGERWGAACCGPQSLELGEASCLRLHGDASRAFAICGSAAAAVQAFHARHAGKYRVRFPSAGGSLCYCGDGTSYQATLVALDGTETLAAWDPSDDRMDLCCG